MQHYTPLRVRHPHAAVDRDAGAHRADRGLLSDRIGARRIVALGLLLQTAGIAWLGRDRPSADVPYPHLVPAFVLAGAGMGLFFAPIARLTIDFAPTALQGVASGTSNALRQLGTVLGVAVLGAVFSAVGGYASADAFVNGCGPRRGPAPPCSRSGWCWRWPSRRAG